MRIKLKFYSGLMAGVLLLSVLVYACTEDIGTPEVQEKEEKPDFTISEAKKLYDMYIGEKPIVKSAGNREAGLSADWGNGETSASDLWSVVEMPANFGGMNKIEFMTNSVSAYIAETGNEAITKNLMRLVIMRSEESGYHYAFIMVVVPELEYIQQRGKELETIRYLKRDSDYNGLILFFDVDGRFVNGWEYVEGERKGKLLSKGNSSNITKKIQENCIGVIEHYYDDDLEMELTGHGILCFQNKEEDSGVSFPSWDDNNNWGDPVDVWEGNSENDIGGGNSPSNSNTDSLPPMEKKDKKPENRTDCDERATKNAADAKNAMEANSDIKNTIIDLSGKASGYVVEFGSRIDYNDGGFSSISSVRGQGTTVSIPMNHPYTMYDIHTHFPLLPGGHSANTYAPSFMDIHSLLTEYQKSQAMGGCYKGSIIIAPDGTQYLVSVDDPSLAGDPSVLETFKLYDGYNIFENEKMNSEYFNIYSKIKDKGFSISDADLFALSYMLDKYNSGLKISKKEKYKENFKETKTELEEKGSTPEYKPTICPEL